MDQKDKQLLRSLIFDSAKANPELIAKLDGLTTLKALPEATVTVEKPIGKGKSKKAKG